MINIALCDDDRNVISELSEYIERKYPPEQGEVSLHTFDSAEKLLETARAEICFHILILDIEMDSINGVELGNILRKMQDGDLYVIIYISMYERYDNDLKDIGYFRFLQKPIDKEKLSGYLERAVRKAQIARWAYHAPGLFQYRVNKEEREIPIKEIAYFRSRHRQLQIYLWNDGKIIKGDLFYAKLEDIHSELPMIFVRCEQSYSVNLRHVDRHYANQFILADEECTKIPISRGYQQPAKKEYFEYQERYYDI